MTWMERLFTKEGKNVKKKVGGVVEMVPGIPAGVWWRLGLDLVDGV